MTFVIRLTAEETGSQKHRDLGFLPWAFTEHGAIMAANVLNSPRAVEMSVHVVRTFVRLRQAALNYEELGRRLLEAEQRLGPHDEHLAAIIRRLREMMEPHKPRKRRPIGFVVTDEEAE